MSIEGPDLSQRDDDKERDEIIALSSNKDRSRAAEKRSIANDTTYVESLRKEALKKANFSDRVAESAENNAALEYDAEKLAENMSDEEVELMAEKMFSLKKDAEKELEEITNKTQSDPSEENERQRLNARWKVDNRSKDAFNWDSILYKRKFK